MKDLWTVASPCEERISLHELRQMLALFVGTYSSHIAGFSDINVDKLSVRAK